VQQSYDAPARAIAEEAGNTIITIPEDPRSRRGATCPRPSMTAGSRIWQGAGLTDRTLIDRARALMADFDAAQ
jgi:hypothetical protein